MRDNREYKTGGNIDMAKIGFIGMGNMGTAIMRGLLKTYKPEELLFTSAHEAKMQKITEETGVAHVSTATDCAEQVKYLHEVDLFLRLVILHQRRGRSGRGRIEFLLFFCHESITSFPIL
jgi:NADH/NAD ratio-sensing transcriptional regulator Rex